MSRSEDAWNARVTLAEALNARVITDLKIGASFPTDHPLYVGAAHALTPDSAEVLRAADVILSLDWVDLAGALKLAPPSPAAKIIQVSLDYRIHNGWSMDYQGLPIVDLFLSADPDAVVPELVKALGAGGRPRAAPPPRAAAAGNDPPGFTNEHIARVPAKGRRRTAGDAHPPADLLGGSLVDLPPSARLSRLRWRRRCRRRTGHLGRRGVGAEEFRPAADRGLRRRRFSDGRHRGVDRGALQDSAALRDRQQPLLL